MSDHDPSQLPPSPYRSASVLTTTLRALWALTIFLMLWLAPLLVLQGIVGDDAFALMGVTFLLSLYLTGRLIYGSSAPRVGAPDRDLRRSSFAHWRADKASNLPAGLRAVVGLVVFLVISLALLMLFAPFMDQISKGVLILPIAVAAFITVWIMVPREERPPPPSDVDGLFE